jgi:hypothetical protein
MSTRPSGGSTETPKPGFGTRVLQVCTVEGPGNEEDRHGVIERHTVFRRVGLSLPRVPLEHVFSKYGMLTSRALPLSWAVSDADRSIDTRATPVPGQVRTRETSTN